MASSERLFKECILAAFALTLTFILADPQNAISATISVTANATDTLNGADGQCSLREAIQNINDATTTYADCAPTGGYGTTDTINIPAGTYTTAIAGAGENLNATGDYDILKSVSIVGAGSSSTTINGGSLDRVFHVTGVYTVTISGVTITGGNTAPAGGGGGGGILNAGGALTVANSTISSNTGYNGGGILNNNSGALTVSNSIITSSTAVNNGGGICINSGTVAVTNSTVSANTATNGYGGGIYNYNYGVLTVTSSTIASNTASDRWAEGGGILNDNTGTLSLANATITSNSAHHGGGIENWGSLTVTNSTISNNTARTGRGGGIRNTGSGSYSLPGGTVTIANSTISGNTAPAGNGGGGIRNASGAVTIAGSTISANTATNGGGIDNSDRITVTDSIITGNTATTSGGGILNYFDIEAGVNPTISVANSTISGNTATNGGGGGIANKSGAVSVTNSTINGNTATGAGGIGSDSGDITVTNSTISGNTATSYTYLGGGIAIAYGGTVTIANTTISGNSASGNVGGGIVIVYGGTANIANSIVAGNTATDCHFGYGGGTVRSSGYNLEGAASCGFTGTGDRQNSNPLLGALANNGGPTQTMALQAGSPAIDAGSCVYAIDQRGYLRPGGTTCDIGAYELNGAVGYPVSATAGMGGAVTPSIQSVASGATASFTVTPNAGYATNTTVNGTCPAGSWNGTAYTTGAVTATCSVGFTFTVTTGLGFLTVTILPPEAVTAGAQWSVDGGATWNASGATAGYAPGSKTVSFKAATNYTSPANQTVTITQGASATATGNYTPFAGSAALKVHILPADAVTAGAQWSVDSGATWNNSDATVSNLAPGGHTITFKPVTGWTPPSNKNVTLTAGQTFIAPGTYTRQGSLTVNISSSPPGIAGAQWRVDGGALQASGATVSNLAPGPHTVSFTTVAGYTAPADKVVRIAAGQSATAAGLYTANYVVTATAAGGSVTPTRQTVLNAANASFTVRANTGYTTPPTVGGSCAAGSFGTWANNSATYTISNVTGACLATFTFAGTPTATTVGAADITQVAATLKGLVNPKNTSTAVTFEHGADTNYGSTVSAGSFTGNTPRIVSARVTGLTCNTTYHFRVAAVNSNGSAPATVDRTFKTAACLAPSVATGRATNIGSSVATLNGRVHPNKGVTTVTFEYGTTNAYGSDVSGGTPTGNVARTVSAQATGLACNTTYHFRIVADNSNGSTPANGSDATFKTGLCPASDLDGNGKSDMLFRDAATGQAQVWIMDGVTATSIALTTVDPGAYTATSGLQAQGFGDFDGDGKYDILWRDAVSGQLTLWMMNGSTVVTSATASANPGTYTATTGLQVNGIGDFNGDGKSDILFRDAGTGQTSIWFMNGATVSANSNTNMSPGAYTSTTGWQVQGVGDFNGDGKSDILLRDSVSGRIAIWLMNGASKSGGGYTNASTGTYTSTTGWQIQGVGDFNGDRKSDILLRYAGTGTTFIWFMNGSARSGFAYTSFQPGAYDSTTGWQLQAVGDFNGDGKSDVLLRYAGTGETYIWLMNGAVVTGDWTSAMPGAYTSTTGLQVISEETIR